MKEVHNIRGFQYTHEGWRFCCINKGLLDPFADKSSGQAFCDFSFKFVSCTNKLRGAILLRIDLS